MTHTSDTAPKPNPPLPETELKFAEHVQREVEVFALNKAKLLQALAQTGITLVVVTFDGYGDSGQIENVEVQAGDDPAMIPTATIEIDDVVWNEPEPRRSSLTVTEAVDWFTYNILDQTHRGWENDDGGCGEVVFDVVKQTITLDFNERYTATSNYTHEF